MSKFEVSVNEIGCGSMTSIYTAKNKIEAMKDAMSFYRLMFCCEEDVTLEATARVVRGD